MQYKILSIDDEDYATQLQIQEGLSATMHVDCVTNTVDAFTKLRENIYDVILLDKFLDKENLNGIDLLPKFRAQFPTTAIIIVTQDRNFSGIHTAIQSGASDYVVKSSFLISDLQIKIPTAIQKLKLSRFYDSQSGQTLPKDCPLVGSSIAINTVNDGLGKIKDSDGSGHIFIEAEPGVGAFTVAKQAWEQKKDPFRPLVYIDFGAIPKELHESLIVGSGDKLSAFIRASCGDLVVLNLELLVPKLKTKFYRIIKTQKYHHTQSKSDIPISVRLISIGTSLPDKQTTNIFSHLIRIPSLVQRPEDISQIILHYLRNNYGGRDIHIIQNAMNYLTTRNWTGNFHQLTVTLDTAIAYLMPHHKEVLNEARVSVIHNVAAPISRPKNREVFVPEYITDISNESYVRCKNDAERAYIETCIFLCKSDMTKTAELLGVSRSFLYERLDKLEISREWLRKTRTNIKTEVIDVSPQ